MHQDSHKIEINRSADPRGGGSRALGRSTPLSRAKPFRLPGRARAVSLFTPFTPSTPRHATTRHDTPRHDALPRHDSHATPRHDASPRLATPVRPISARFSAPTWPPKSAKIGQKSKPRCSPFSTSFSDRFLDVFDSQLRPAGSQKP